MGSDFTPEQIAAQGKNCVHGYWVNLTSVTYFTGDAATLNDHFGTLGLKAKATYATKKVVLHPGPKKASSPWDNAERNISTDWSVTLWLDGGMNPGAHLQIDIWLGGQVKLEDLRIPADVEVVSGGEIEKFIQERMEKSK